MNSSIPFQFQSSPGLRSTEKEAPIAASFSRTLRAFGEQQPAEPLRQRLESRPPQPRPQPVRATPIPEKKDVAPKKDVKIPGLPLREAAKAVDLKALKAAVAPASAEKPAPAAKPAKPRDAAWLTRAWAWLKKHQSFSPSKQLRVSETVSLGEKRFVAVVHIEGQKFLIGGGASGVSLLAELDTDMDLEAEEVSGMLQPIACAGGRSQ